VNRFVEDKWPWIEGMHGMRKGILDMLSDADLAYSPGGQAVSLGALLREIGEIEYAYIQSLKTFNTDFSYRNPDPGLETSTTRLSDWYISLDEALHSTVSALSDDDLKKPVGRSSGNSLAVELQLEGYLQAMLIFLGKATVYLRAMSKPLPPSVEQWIA
jgi:hypothetical protein